MSSSDQDKLHGPISQEFLGDLRERLTEAGTVTHNLHYNQNLSQEDRDFLYQAACTIDDALVVVSVTCEIMKLVEKAND